MSKEKKNSKAAEKNATEFNPFQEKDELSDVAFVVEGKKLFVNKSLMMIHSPVFQKMFTTKFKEKDSKEIPLPGKKHSAMVALLKQIYPGEGVESIKYENLPSLLKLADEYDVQQVFINCRQYIARQFDRNGGKLSTDSILFYLAMVETYKGLHSLREKLVDLASHRSVQELQNNEHYSSVPATAQRDVFLRRLLSIEEEKSRTVDCGVVVKYK